MKLTDGKTFAEISITRNGDCRGDLADKYFRTTFPKDFTAYRSITVDDEEWYYVAALDYVITVMNGDGENGAKKVCRNILGKPRTRINIVTKMFDMRDIIERIAIKAEAEIRITKYCLDQRVDPDNLDDFDACVEEVTDTMIDVMVNLDGEKPDDESWNLAVLNAVLKDSLTDITGLSDDEIAEILQMEASDKEDLVRACRNEVFLYDSVEALGADNCDNGCREDDDGYSFGEFLLTVPECFGLELKDGKVLFAYDVNLCD